VGGRVEGVVVALMVVVLVVPLRRASGVGVLKAVGGWVSACISGDDGVGSGGGVEWVGGNGESGSALVVVSSCSGGSAGGDVQWWKRWW
jgi:hypothetical protein